ncbi:RraA family protein [Cupriavidus basilensis]|uniref:RraA family protein n=1 Tax=Cupriavidus basilensis TaxID=68895 RepID=UPI001D207E68|nr:RraA family protein [Cupriavidus basilensis]NUA30304.1 RraA family protein [Cupriavidus basilensis]
METTHVARSATERETIRQRFLLVDTSNVADVLDTLGLFDQGLSSAFTPFPAYGGKLAGWAYTIRGQMSPYALGGDPDKMKACAGVSAGDVTVWSGDGEGICYFGELIAIGMKERGCVGSLIDGGIRDIRWIAAQAFPVFARYRTPVQSIARWKVNGWQVPVSIRGATSQWVQVRPGDFVLGDEDGVLVIPHEVLDTVLIEAERLTEQERSIRVELQQGLSLADALAKYGHV